MTYKTGKKEQIRELLMEDTSRAYTLEEICGRLLVDGHGRSTVYRLVSGMLADGEIRRMSDGKTRRTTYQYVGDEHCKHHLHLKCKGCGRLIHLDENITENISRTLLSVGGFRIDEGELLLGRCSECNLRGEL